LTHPNSTAWTVNCKKSAPKSSLLSSTNRKLKKNSGS